MDITLLSDLKRKMFIRSALISLPSIDELLGLNDYLSADEILLELIKKSLREFEITNPLFLDMNVNQGQLPPAPNQLGYSEIKSNFQLYLDGIIDESRIILVPNSMPSWRMASVSSPTATCHTYFTDYRRPYVFTGDLLSGLDNIVIRGICSRPIIPEFDADKSFSSNSNKAAVYWMNIEEGARGAYFLDLCMVNLLDFIRQLKSSILLPNMSVDILSNVDNAYMELRTRCEQQALQSGWYGELLS